MHVRILSRLNKVKPIVLFFFLVSVFKVMFLDDVNDKFVVISERRACWICFGQIWMKKMFWKQWFDHTCIVCGYDKLYNIHEYNS